MDTIEHFNIIREYPVPNAPFQKQNATINNKFELKNNNSNNINDNSDNINESNDKNKLSYVDMLNYNNNSIKDNIKDRKFDFAKDFKKTNEYADDYYSEYDIFTKDVGILRNLRINNDNILSNFQEIDYYSMFDILKKTKQYINNNKNWVKCEFDYPYKNKILDDSLLSFLIIIINKFYIASKYFNKYHQISLFKLHDFKIYVCNYCQADNIINYKLNIYIGRHIYSIQKFAIAIDLVIKNKDFKNINNIYINTLEVIGVNLEDNIRNEKKDDNEIKDNYETKEKTNILNIKLDDDAEYKCFYLGGELPKHNGNRLNCESYHPDVNSIGVFDKPCKTNEECPFYSSVSTRGGCMNDGYCEMPYGITPIGYKKIYKYSSPKCYNGECNEKNKNYMFISDTIK